MADDEHPKKKKFYFAPRMDIAMLVEVLRHNPYKNGNGVYYDIQACLNQRDDFDVERRTLQDRVDRLLKLFRNDQLPNRSGTEKEYEERERLLQNLSDLEKEWASRKRCAPPLPLPALCPVDVHSKVPRLDTASPCGRQIHQQLAAPLEPTAEIEIDTDVPVIKQEYGDEDVEIHRQDELEPDLLPNQVPQENGRPHSNKSRQPFSTVSCWCSNLDVMRSEIKRELELKKKAMEIKKEELRMREEELELRRLEAENERRRLELQDRQQKEQAEREERRGREEREEWRRVVVRQEQERKELMDRQSQMMDTLLQIVRNQK